MTQKDILLMCPLHKPTQERLEDTYPGTRRLYAEADKGALIEKLAPTCEVVVTSGGVGIDAATLSRMPKVKLVSCFGVGIDAVDLPYCKSHGIAVTNTPDVLTDDVADLAVALVLATVRRVVDADRYLRAGSWLKAAYPLTTAIRGRKVGIVGMGRIGQAIAHRMAAFGTEIAYFGPRPKQVAYRYVDDPVALGAWSDILIAACPGGEATRKVVSAKVLEALGPKGYFVNIARGSVVDQDALIRLLTDKKLAGAGLDVFDDEPRVPKALIDLDRVVLQPHHASGTDETRKAMGDLTVGNVDAYFAGKPLLTPV
ncbi:MAG: 2-hydroxyacid dehydrogenase [Lautropia sp.]